MRGENKENICSRILRARASGLLRFWCPEKPTLTRWVFLCPQPKDSQWEGLLSKGVAMSELQILRLPEVRAKTGLSRSTIYRLEASGQCPKRIQLGEHSSGWLESEWDAWIAERVAARERAA